MPSRKLEAQLEALSGCKRSTPTDETTALLRKSLADSSGLVIGKAAEAVAHLNLRDLLPLLVSSYGRLFEQGVKRDPQCWGKIGIAKALQTFEYDFSEPFVRALQYQQWEPVWGTVVDTAEPLRSLGCLMLVGCTDLLREDKLWLLMRALTDGAAGVRLHAARALEQMEGREAALLLRLKARMGDKEAANIGQILQSLLTLEGASGVPFVSEFVHQTGWAARDSEVAEQAALALEVSRLPEALASLIAGWNQRASGQVDTGTLLRAISSARQEPALDFLLGLVRDGRQGEAVAAVEALGLHEHSDTIRSRTEAVVKERDNHEVQSAFERTFK